MEVSKTARINYKVIFSFSVLNLYDLVYVVLTREIIFQCKTIACRDGAVYPGKQEDCREERREVYHTSVSHNLLCCLSRGNILQ